MTNSNQTYVLYHGACADGFAAALVAWLALGEGPSYKPVYYGEAMPEMEDGSDVYILDFSYSADEMRALLERMRYVQVIDHHASARGTLQGKLWAVFDTAKSGAVLAWQHFFTVQPLPILFRYVQDRDLGLRDLPDSQEVSAALASHPFDFWTWKEFLRPEAIARLRDEGRIALRVIDEAVQRLAGRAETASLPYRGATYRVPAVNTPIYRSEVCHELLQRNPEAPFAAAWHLRDGVKVWSLRSRKDFDCSVIAEYFGGGGHPQACGFEEPAVDGSTGGLSRIKAERVRQIAAKGFNEAHDAAHRRGELASAAACYAEAAEALSGADLAELPPNYATQARWPWGSATWKPSNDPLRNLEKAGALIAAEIDRIAEQRSRGVAVCADCDGTGTVEMSQYSPEFTESVLCPRCGGDGRDGAALPKEGGVA